LPSQICTAQHQRGADGNDDERDRLATFDRFDGHFFHHQADDGRQHNGQHQRQRQAQAGVGEVHRQHAAQHDELALREVNHMAGVVDQRETQGGQRVGGAYRDAREQELQKLGQHQARTHWP
jgi:hypothetical protein